MRVNIVTVYNSLNYGSYYQSLALKEILKRYGIVVKYLDTNSRFPLKETIKKTVKNILVGNYKYSLFYLNKYIKFVKYQKKFSIVKKNQIELNDKFCLGSDEIWNISRNDFKNYPIFFGKGLEAYEVFSYAPSINTTSIEMLQKSSYVKDCLNSLNKISVRDIYSKNIIEGLVNKEVSLVLDPTFLLNIEDYKKIQDKNFTLNQDYIVVYSYGYKMNEEKINEIKRFASIKNMKLISIGFVLPWCDLCIPASPGEFLTYIDNAKYIITDTFHGTVFSIIYNKEFISIVDGNTKILEILKLLGLEERNLKSIKDIETLFKKKVCYDDVTPKLKELKQNSINYLCEAIKGE